MITKLRGELSSLPIKLIQSHIANAVVGHYKCIALEDAPLDAFHMLALILPNS
jgi:hypothetical protein